MLNEPRSRPAFDELLRQPLRPVSGDVVGHDNLHLAEQRLTPKRIDAPFQPAGAVIVEDNDRDQRLRSA